MTRLSPAELFLFTWLPWPLNDSTRFLRCKSALKAEDKTDETFVFLSRIRKKQHQKQQPQKPFKNHQRIGKMLKMAARTEQVHSDIFSECNKSEKAGGGGAVGARECRGKPRLKKVWREI